MTLEEKIGYTFKRKILLEQALTPPLLQKHKYGKVFERLEFLGDRLLGLVIAEALYAYFPKATEGDLAKRLGHLTSREFCHRIAETLQLQEHINIAPQDLKGTSVLANVIEALIAAIYSDCGSLETVQSFIHRFWQDAIEEVEDLAKDPKSTLQEWVQKRGMQLPLYSEIGRSGPDHSPEYKLEVSIDTGEKAIGLGKNKKIAERDAATNLLQIIDKGIKH
jgi:ribonuclease-3